MHPEKLKQSKAQEYFHKSLEIKKEIVDKYGMAITYGQLGRFFRYNRGDFENAMDNFTKDLNIAKELGSLKGQTLMLSSLGECSLKMGNISEAKDHYRESLDLAHFTKNKHSQCFAFTGLMETATAAGELEAFFEDKGPGFTDICKAINEEGEFPGFLSSRLTNAPDLIQGPITDNKWNLEIKNSVLNVEWSERY